MQRCLCSADPLLYYGGVAFNSSTRQLAFWNETSKCIEVADYPTLRTVQVYNIQSDETVSLLQWTDTGSLIAVVRTPRGDRVMLLDKDKSQVIMNAIDIAYASCSKTGVFVGLISRNNGNTRWEIWDVYRNQMLRSLPGGEVKYSVDPTGQRLLAVSNIDGQTKTEVRALSEVKEE